MKRLFSILLLFLLITQTACGDKSDDVPSDDTEKVSETVTDETEPEYVFPNLDWDGDTFTVLNANTTWGFYHYMDFEEQTGEKLDDAIYERTVRSRKCTI